MNLSIFLTITFLLFGFCEALGQSQLYQRNQTNLSRLEVPNLSTKPPLRSDMPYEIMVSWLVADSICKSVNREDIETYLNNTSDDTVQMAAKYLFRLRAYDGIMTDKYSREVSEDDNYKSNLDYLTQAVYQQFSSRFGMSYLDSNIWRISRIYIITVTGKETFPQMVGSTDSCTNNCIFANVDSVLKGGVMYDYCQNITAGNRCGVFSWTSGDTIRTTLRTWNLMWPENSLEVGSSYLIFVYDYLVDGNNSYFTSLYWLARMMGPERIQRWRGAFKVAGDSISDPGEFFGLGLNPNLHDVITVINNVLARY